nr:hypothetical protein [Tanacetum cinerariifolium]
EFGEPANYKAALLDPESKKWPNAMNVEMQSIKDNEVWVLVELPPNGKTVGSKWLFKKKTDMDGVVYTYKARLVAKGYTQTPGIDYKETFSLVADIRAIRILIVIAAYYDHEIWQMDVKIAFLNGYLNEEVYMEQPEGFIDPKYPNQVCKLKRSIYGLKQASRCFAIKDLGEATYIIGIKIYKDRSRRLIGLCQSAYIEKILKRYCIENSKRGSIPMQEKLKLSKSQEIAPVTIIDRQLPSEYTVASRSTDAMMMALPVQNINHLAFRSMFEKEKLSVYDAYNEVACLILGSMTPELHRQIKNSSPYDMIKEFKSMFEKQARVEWFELIKTFHACKQEEGKPVGAYVLKMKDYVEQLERLGYVLLQDISVGLILNGLISDLADFVKNYNMHNMRKTVGELHALLIEYEKGLPKKAGTPQVMAIQGGRTQKANKKSLNVKGKDKRKGKGKENSYIPKPKNLKPSAKEHPKKNDACHHYKEVGHWKVNYLVYLAELIKKKKQVGTPSSSSILELFSFPKNSWVFNTGCGTHICNTKQGLKGAKKLKQGALYLYVGNVSKNNVLYFNAISTNGIYEIDMINRVPNVNSIYTVSNKRARHNLDSTYLWHCRLAHISKKHIEKMQHDMLFKSTDEESFDKCVSCLSVKMTKKPFPHRTERATSLLEIIHTDVCGPLRHVSRQGASYFITFTNDYSHYGYVYLLKHKHEVLETFKVFKNEMENQLGKTIKALRLDRRGEYIIQEFKDYLKACGIVKQLTPLYTSQHNRVFERRNRTLLDMVRSMMKLTTQSLSFWNYALETATRILNMVSTKKVDNTPYELWYGKVHNLSYLKVWGAVDWKSSKQSTTAMSATKAEYIAASEAAMEAVWIRKFISGLDPFTKALSKEKLTQHARSMGLRLASSFM